MPVNTSAYYAWRKRPEQLISADVSHLHRRMKVLFEQSRNSLDSHEMMKKLREQGILYVSGYRNGFVLTAHRGLVHQRTNDNRFGMQSNAHGLQLETTS